MKKQYIFEKKKSYWKCIDKKNGKELILSVQIIKEIGRDLFEEISNSINSF